MVAASGHGPRRSWTVLSGIGGCWKNKAASKVKMNESFCQPMHVIFWLRLGVLFQMVFPMPPNQLGSHRLMHNNNAYQGVLVVGLGTPSFEKKPSFVLDHHTGANWFGKRVSMISGRVLGLL
jgi:hypothetical protein